MFTMITGMVAFIILLFWLLAYAGIITVLILVLRKIGVAKRRLLFASFTLFGILWGLLAALRLFGETALMINPGCALGDEMHVLSIGIIGDPHSAYAGYTIPWALRIPQIYLFTSAIVWGLIAALTQLIYNRRKKPPVAKGLSTPIIILSLLACLAICTGLVYGTQKAYEKPLEPGAVPVVEIGTSPIPDWETITTYEVERLHLSETTIFTGRDLEVTAWVKNTGMRRGIVKVGLSLNDKVLSSQKVALLPRETKPVRFEVTVPEEGSYAVGMGDLTASFEAKKPL